MLAKCRAPGGWCAPTYPHWSQDSDPQMPGQSLETAAPDTGHSRSLAVPQLTCHNHQLCDNLVIIGGEKQKLL